MVSSRSTGVAIIHADECVSVDMWVFEIGGGQRYSLSKSTARGDILRATGLECMWRARDARGLCLGVPVYRCSYAPCMHAHGQVGNRNPDSPDRFNWSGRKGVSMKMN